MALCENTALVTGGHRTIINFWQIKKSNKNDKLLLSNPGAHLKTIE